MDRERITYNGKEAVFIRELQCFVRSVHYDFASKTGIIEMLEGNCCDMSGSIRYFQNIDPDVEEIYSCYSQDHPDTQYRKKNGKWAAYRSRRPRPIQDEELYG